MTNGKKPDNADFADRFWSKVDRRAADECWLWTACRFRLGYGSFRAGGRSLSAHRVSYELSTGQIPQGMHVLHSCDVRACCNPAHLRLGTHADNMSEMAARGRCRNRGYGRCLTMRQAREIRSLVGPNPQRGERAAIARKYAVSHCVVNQILSGKSYREALPPDGLATKGRHEARASNQTSEQPRRGVEGAKSTRRAQAT